MGQQNESGQNVRTAATLEKLLKEAADTPHGRPPNRVDVDPAGWGGKRPARWPEDAVFQPCAWCTDRYMIVDFLARGGFAEIYAARDGVTGDYVALKALRVQQRTNIPLLEKTAAEARTLKKIDHPNVVRVFDAGIAHESRHLLLFFVMELLDGASLLHHIHKAPSPEQEPRTPAIPLLVLIPWAIEIARGIGALHSHGVVHRDIKPENIQITTKGPKLFDLNASKYDPSYDLNTTAEGTTTGTVSYMSPEHINFGRTDPRSDIYQFGFAVLLEGVLGHHAFLANRAQRCTLEEMQGWHRFRNPPRLRDLIPALAPELDAVIALCTHKEPARRFQNIPELLVSLIALHGTLVERAAQGREEGAEPARREQEQSAEPARVIVPVGAPAGRDISVATTDLTATVAPSKAFQIVPEPIFAVPPVEPRGAAPGNDTAPLAEPSAAGLTSGIVLLAGSRPDLPPGAVAPRGPTGTAVIETLDASRASAPPSVASGPHGTAIVRTLGAEPRLAPPTFGQPPPAMPNVTQPMPVPAPETDKRPSMDGMPPAVIGAAPATEPARPIAAALIAPLPGAGRAQPPSWIGRILPGAIVGLVAGTLVVVLSRFFLPSPAPQPVPSNPAMTVPAGTALPVPPSAMASTEPSTIPSAAASAAISPEAVPGPAPSASDAAPPAVMAPAVTVSATPITKRAPTAPKQAPAAAPSVTAAAAPPSMTAETSQARGKLRLPTNTKPTPIKVNDRSDEPW